MYTYIYIYIYIYVGMNFLGFTVAGTKRICRYIYIYIYIYIDRAVRV